MDVTLEKRSETDYVALADLGVNTYTYRDHQFQIPVKLIKNGVTKYKAQLCGFQVESDREKDIPKLVRYLLDRLINLDRLPDYVFVADRAKRLYPVYTVGNEVAVTTPNGPVFRHVELAKVREYLTDYLHETKILGQDGKSDKLHVRGIDHSTLGLRAPLFYLKKYNENETRFWAPVFESDDRTGIYVYAANNRRDVPKDDGREVIQLIKLVSELLVTQNRLTDLYDLRADRLKTAYWEIVKSAFEPVGNRIEVGSKTLDIYKSGMDFIAVEHREKESREKIDRFGLYLGKSVEDLTKRVLVDFKRRGFS